MTDIVSEAHNKFVNAKFINGSAIGSIRQSTLLGVVFRNVYVTNNKR